MKNEIKKDEELSRLLDQFEVRMPKRLYEKPSKWQRFVQYLCSPTKDPLEEVSDSTTGFAFLRVFPLACGFVLAVIQAIVLMS